MQETPAPSSAPETSAGPRRDIMIIVGILAVGCCAVVGLGISGYFLYQSFQSNVSAAATSQMQVTQAARRTELAEATLQAQATQTARRTELASFDFYETFADNGNDWYTGDEDSDFWRGAIKVSDGVYGWNVLENKQPFIAWEGYNSQVSYQDFDVTVDVRRAEGPEDQACYGLLFRESTTTVGFDDGAYTFSVCDTPQFSVHYFSAETNWEVLIDWTDESAIRPGEWNTLGIRARGAEFTFLINGKEVGTATDSRVTEGYIYPYVDMYESATGLIQFDNFGISTR